MTEPSKSKLKNITTLPIRRVSTRDVGHPLKLYRTMRLAALFSVHPSTIWRWRKTGVLPPPVKLGGIEGWTDQQLHEVMSRQGAGNG